MKNRKEFTTEYAKNCVVRLMEKKRNGGKFTEQMANEVVEDIRARINQLTNDFRFGYKSRYGCYPKDTLVDYFESEIVAAAETYYDYDEDVHPIWCA